MMATTVKEKNMTKNTPLRDLALELVSILDYTVKNEKTDGEEHPLFKKQALPDGFVPNRILCCDVATQKRVDDIIAQIKTHVHN